MKKKILLIIICLLIISITGCGTKKETPEKTYQFKGKIIEVYEDGNFIVEPDKGEEIRRSADKISVTSMADRIWQVGDYVIVTYTGEVMESYPAQIKTIDVQIYQKK